MSFIYSLLDTWNAVGTTFNTIYANISNGAGGAPVGAAASKALLLQANSTDIFGIDINGAIQNPTFFDVYIAGTRSIRVTSNSFEFSTNSGSVVPFLCNGVPLAMGADGSTKDLYLVRNAAGIHESSGSSTVGSGGIIPGMRLATTQVVTTLANNNSAQNVFAAANDVLTLVASTTYFFECLYYLDTGATTHTTATGFVASSAFTSINYWAELWSTTAGTISTTAPSVLNVAASTATVLNATSTATRTTIRCSGIIRTNATSTVTPQITFSADPTGTCTVGVNSYFRIWPVGSNTVAAVGAWA